ncbi:DUF4124 domain-containing protein [Luteimonas sp. MC1828]|uniref:DUF4124 domain-containing protein n=1 Tax=Luteimonas sp. MC1828 TaxID=2799787 RepID=UPI0018F1FE03|nr:DUF4124 domain-containing protein [Luteimonas sp. MC1828]MBJ7575035.1 DUF4124 domain-containing protein [Luteimonas sp. MC1828]
MDTRWAVVAGIAAGIAVAWWVSREPEAAEEARRARAEQAAAANAEDARPVLYRWTDDAGVVQVTQEPPPRGRRFEKVDIQPREGIEVDGRRL